MFVSTFLALWALILTINPAEASGGEHEWDYDHHNGPQTKKWADLCHDGQRQSPINIDVKATVEDTSLADLAFKGYNQHDQVTVANSHHSVVATGFDKWEQNPSIEGGGLDGKYNLIGFHLHWGQDDTLGSEHQVNFVPFPLEAHFVHIKDGFDLEDALLLPDGLAVVGVLFKLDNNDTALKKLDTVYQDTIPVDATGTVELKLSRMLPADRTSFYRYEGSLTTPGCNEAVIWTVMAEKVAVSAEQVNRLRQHRDTVDHTVTHNFRNLQKLYDRKVYRSFTMGNP